MPEDLNELTVKELNRLYDSTLVSLASLQNMDDLDSPEAKRSAGLEIRMAYRSLQRLKREKNQRQKATGSFWKCKSCGWVNGSDNSKRTASNTCSNCNTRRRDPSRNVSYVIDPKRDTRCDLNAGKYRRSTTKQDYRSGNGAPRTWSDGTAWA